MSVEHLVHMLRAQGSFCASSGSPMYGDLFELVASDVEAGGVFADILSGHRDAPSRDAIPLRPILAAAAEHAAALIGGLLHINESCLPVRLFEIGSSAGLNLRADHYRYRYAGGGWGPADSPVCIDDAWRGAARGVRIVERHGFDIAPVDVGNPDGELTVLSYVWPDQAARLAAADAVRVDRAVALDHLAVPVRRGTRRGVRRGGARAGAPDGGPRVLAQCHPHGPPVDWL